MNKRRKSLKILICDDDPQDRKLVRLYIKDSFGSGTVMLEAGNESEIETVLRESGIDLVLMDIQMPDKSGTAWLEQLVKQNTAPVVMLTGCGNEEIAVESLHRGAIDYLPKNNLSSEKLKRVISEVLTKWKQLQTINASHEHLERLAYFDSLSGLYNKRAILRKLEEQISITRRYEEELSVSMMDIDNFKSINDCYGHIIGDDVLRGISSILSNRIRDTDMAGRYGGDEFILIFTKMNLLTSKEIAERIRQRIEMAEIDDSRGRSIRVTASQGVATYKHGDDKFSLISRADAALLTAKRQGRNRVEIRHVQGPTPGRNSNSNTLSSHI